MILEVGADLVGDELRNRLAIVRSDQMVRMERRNKQGSDQHFENFESRRPRSRLFPTLVILLLLPLFDSVVLLKSGHHYLEMATAVRIWPRKAVSLGLSDGLKRSSLLAARAAAPFLSPAPRSQGPIALLPRSSSRPITTHSRDARASIPESDEASSSQLPGRSSRLSSTTLSLLLLAALVSDPVIEVEGHGRSTKTSNAFFDSLPSQHTNYRSQPLVFRTKRARDRKNSFLPRLSGRKQQKIQVAR